MSIPFTQYLRPNGEKRYTSIKRPPEIEALANHFIALGGKFESEELTTGQVSLTAAVVIDGEWQDVEYEIIANGPPVLPAVDRLVKRAVTHVKGVTIYGTS